MKKSVILIALLTVAGCTTPAPPPRTQPPPSASANSAETEPDKRVIVDPALNSIIRVVSVKSNIGADGFFRFEVVVQNLTPTVKTIAYTAHWIDRDGELMDVASADLPWTLMRNETSSVSIAAPAPTVKDFLLHIHEYKR